MIAILDYGLGNLGALKNILNYIGVKAQITDDYKKIGSSSHLLLPGVGAFDSGVEKLKESGLIDSILEFSTIRQRPILGICLGMQLLGKSSEEGVEKGLGLLDFRTVNLVPNDSKLKIPHMGWNEVSIVQSSPLFKELENHNRFYFVHSYCVECFDFSLPVGVTNYGLKFVSAIQKDNIFAVQFHPEKSHKYGMKLLKNFSEI